MAFRLSLILVEITWITLFQWCDCKVLKVIPPTQAEIDKDAELEREEQLKEEQEKADSPSKNGENGSPSKSKKNKKTFFPPDHLFKYELEELEDEDDESGDEGEKKKDEDKVPEVHTIDAEDIRREKGTYTREKNLLFLKNITELGKDGNFQIKKSVAEKYRVSQIQFTDLFAGPMPVFEITKRVKNAMPAFTAKNKKDPSKKAKGQGTLDSWVKGEGITQFDTHMMPMVLFVIMCFLFLQVGRAKKLQAPRVNRRATRSRSRVLPKSRLR